MKSSKKKAVEGAKAVPIVRVVLEGEVILVALVSEVMRTEVKVSTVPFEVSGDAIVMGEPSNAVAKMVGEVEAPSGEGPPLRAEGES